MNLLQRILNTISIAVMILFSTFQFIREMVKKQLNKIGRFNRNSNFPLTDTIKKASLFIFKVTGKERLTSFEKNPNIVNQNAVIITYGHIKQQRDNYIFQNLPKGEYIIVPAIFKPGDFNNFCLEFHFPDKILAAENTSSSIKLKHTIIERLNKPNLHCK